MSKLEPTIEESTVKKCPHCFKETCKCEHLICPFHGLVIAIPEGKNFTCESKDCNITRTSKELETK